MADPKGQRIEELERQLESKTAEIDSKQKDVEMCIRQRDAAEKLRDDWKEKYLEQKRHFDICKAHNEDAEKKISELQEENKKLMEKLDVAERELEKANAVFKNEFEKRSSLQRQYDEIKMKNQNICSTIADMVRKIMQE